MSIRSPSTMPRTVTESTAPTSSRTRRRPIGSPVSSRAEIHLPGTETRPGIYKALKDKLVHVRLSAIRACTARMEKEAVPELIQHVERHEGVSEGHGVGEGES